MFTVGGVTTLAPTSLGNVDVRTTITNELCVGNAGATAIVVGGTMLLTFISLGNVDIRAVMANELSASNAGATVMVVGGVTTLAPTSLGNVDIRAVMAILDNGDSVAAISYAGTNIVATS